MKSTPTTWSQTCGIIFKHLQHSHHQVFNAQTFVLQPPFPHLGLIPSFIVSFSLLSPLPPPSSSLALDQMDIECPPPIPHPPLYLHCLSGLFKKDKPHGFLRTPTSWTWPLDKFIKGKAPTRPLLTKTSPINTLPLPHAFCVPSFALFIFKHDWRFSTYVSIYQLPKFTLNQRKIANRINVLCWLHFRSLLMKNEKSVIKMITDDSESSREVTVALMERNLREYIDVTSWRQCETALDQSGRLFGLMRKLFRKDQRQLFYPGWGMRRALAHSLFPLFRCHLRPHSPTCGRVGLANVNLEESH